MIGHKRWYLMDAPLFLSIEDVLNIYVICRLEFPRFDFGGILQQNPVVEYDLTTTFGVGIGIDA
jgi:hypothetical protein